MLPISLVTTILLLLQTTCNAQRQLEFTSHHQLDLQQQSPSQFIVQDGHGESNGDFSLSPSYPLPRTSGVLKTRTTTVHRPRSLDVLHRVRLRSLQHAESDADQVVWDKVDVQGPDVEDIHTLAQLARMSGNAYALPGQKRWYDVDHAWNTSFPFGWEDSDGFRGHVFLSSDNSTIVLSIKGTTLQGPTSKLDKFNDNLLFSCCCARVDISWVFRTVCDCYANHWRCDDQCLTDALVQDSLFYSVGVKLVDDLIHIYPSANVWLVGHSLGGALASLLGATYGLPAVAFESPGEKLAASRLHLPLPPPITLPTPLPPPPTPQLNRHRLFPFPSKPTQPSIPFPDPSTPAPDPPADHHPISTTHVYHTADPIPQGTCTGMGSPCSQAGFALETRCHLGQSIIFDTVGKLGWAVDVRKHVIREVVTHVLEGDVWWGEEDADDGGEVEVDGVERGEDATALGFRTGWRKKKKGGSDDDKNREGKRNVPKAIIESGCVDCFKWEFGNFKDDDSKGMV
ncbi:Alpha/Beta hydrolase protein [Crassisporium funariophilum]|nr:Alpha/Beta hydrolase protein [Crassisporium funariophilum]